MSTPKVTKRKEKPPGTKTDTSAPMSTPKVAKDKSPGKKKDTSTVTPAAATPHYKRKHPTLMQHWFTSPDVECYNVGCHPILH
jgi:hypothetical protein